MRAAVFHGPEDVRVEERPQPRPGPGSIVVRVEACGICGSDLHTYARGALVEPGQVMGHEFSGVIAAAAPDADPRLRVGDRVTALPLVRCGGCRRCAEDDPYLCERCEQLAFGLPGAFAELIEIPRAVLGVSVFRIPDDLPFEHGAVIEPLAVAVHATAALRPRLADAVAVFGLGMIGAGMVQLLRLRGVHRIVGFDPSPARRRLALRLGATAVHAPTGDVRDALQDPSSDGFDAVVDCSSRPEMLAAGLRAVRRGGQVVAVSQYPGEVTIDPRLLMNREIALRGSFAFRAREFGEALALVASGRIDTESLLSGRFPLRDIELAFRRQLDPEAGLKVMVLPNDDGGA